MGTPRLLTLCLLSAALAGCGALPASGPRATAVYTGASTVAYGSSADRLRYGIVDITPETLRLIPANSGESFSGRFTDRRPAPTLRLGVGDVIEVAIFEASAGGLFIPAEAGARAGNFIQLPAQEVDRQGNISVPYAGTFAVAGRTIRDVQAAIEERLRNRAIEPQVVVTLTDRRSAQVSVLGDVGSGRLTLNPLGERVLDVIARSGGTKYPGYETFVTLQRGRERATVRFNRLLESSSDNIFVLPGDTLYVFRQAPTFLVFGAAGQQGQVFFEKQELSMAEALAKIGGLQDSRSDPDSVFVFRFEDRDVAQKLGLDVSKLQHAKTVPLIYRAKLRDPSGFFLTSSFRLRDRDIIYVANSASVEWLKFISFINQNISFAETAVTVPDIGSSNSSTTVLRTTDINTGTQ